MSHVTQLFQTNSKFATHGRYFQNIIFISHGQFKETFFLQLKPHFIEKLYLQVYTLDLLSTTVRVDLLFFVLSHSLKNDLK